MNGVRLKEHKPWRPWRLGETSPVHVSPWRLLEATMRDNLTSGAIETVFAAVETTKALNRMMGKSEFHGVPT